MPFGPASLLGVERFAQESEAPLELIPGDDDAKKEQIITAVYKQVLGNAYVMESERQLVAESQFKLGELSVREFVRSIAKSELYKARFFDACPRYRYIELAFRHLLGRAPVDFQEMRNHAERLDSKGYDADIDSFLDSDDYQSTFGEWTVPYQRGWKTESCGTMQEFTWSFQLLRGNSSSSLKGDLAGISSKLGGAAYQLFLLLLSIPRASVSDPRRTSPTPQPGLAWVRPTKAKPSALRLRPTAPTMCAACPVTAGPTACITCPSTSSPSSSSAFTARAERSPASLR
jgi:hypothetical protein